jgi:translocation protein SEC62
MPGIMRSSQNGDFDPQLVHVARAIRKATASKSQECILSERRVDALRGSAIRSALLDPAFAKAKGVPPVRSDTEADEILKRMLSDGFFIRARSVNQTRFLQPEPGKPWADDAIYAWLWEDSQLGLYLASFLLVAGIFAAFLFPLWPTVLRTGITSLFNYAVWAVVAFIIFLVVISIVRFVVFHITSFALPPGIWILPNLWEDCGFFESFVPLWDWEKPTEKVAAKND